ncbi:hypothetical protein NYG90_06160 [Helicobacter sp. XJK30-2]|uniref:Uncharacterized protein n=1 Tax=Helicobacter zhangjianzhongii TaxID=2974574 RepID=A0ACC6FTI7_9HELI|nr:hypothetical protein [Helicobacter sp. XJK30-2]MDL0082253.1 hypothetical protein [Helicobacter sp. XJK30-2]
MDKHKLSEILQALPDSFSFTAVLEEAIKEKEGVSEQSQEQIQAQTLQDQIAEAYLESKEQELWEDMQDTERWWRWAVSTGDLFYDLVSKQWVDSDSYWGARIKEQLESSGIFMSEDEFASVLDFTHPALESYSPICDLKSFYYYNLDDFIAYLKTTKKE